MDSTILKDVLKIQINLTKKNADQIETYFDQVITNVSKHKDKINSRFNFNPTIKEREHYKKIYKELCEFSKTAPAQRTKEWHEFRNGKLTENGIIGGTLSASDTGTVLGLNPYATADDVILKKIGKSKFEFSIACNHGIKYEEITIMIYTHRTGHKVTEFPCIPDKEIKWLAASPDGITEIGDMVEIKNVNSRKISGYPKPAYYAQMQQQLHVCGLNKCDFVETKIVEYKNFDEYLNDGEKYYTEYGNEKGGIIEYVIGGENNYLYPPSILLTPVETKKWINEQITNLGDLYQYDSVRPIYWKCIIYSCIPVYRDDLWWKNNFSTLEAFWERVLEVRENPDSFTVKSPGKSKKKTFARLNLSNTEISESALFEDTDEE